MNDFQKSFGQMQRASWFKESFLVEGKPFEALAIGEIDASTRMALGGNLSTATLEIRVSLAVLQQSGVIKGTYLHAREQRLKVVGVKFDGTDARTLYCESSAATAKL